MIYYRCIGGQSLITPQFTETLIASNPELNSTTYFSKSWKDYDLLKFVTVTKSDLTERQTYYVTKTQLTNIQTLDGTWRLYHTGSSQYAPFKIYDDRISHTLTSNFELYEVYGVQTSNCQMNVDNIYVAPNLDIGTHTVTSSESLFEYDLLFCTYNPASATYCYVGNSLVSPVKPNEPFKNKIYYYVDVITTGYQLNFIDEHTLNSNRYLTVVGIKFT